MERNFRDYRTLPNALSQENVLFSRLLRQKAGVFLDYDGTLTPINPHPHQAFLSEDMRKSVKDLSKEVNLAIVSGRNKDNIEDLVSLPDIYYVGNHGFDIEGPRKNHLRLEVGLEFIPVLEKCYKEACDQLMVIPGVLFEPKKMTITFNYGFVADDQVKLVFDILKNIVSKYSQLKMTTGKKVLEIRPNINWDKGQAVLWLANQLNLNQNESFILYIGDDVTDEDAFFVLPQNGAGILVGNHSDETYADYHLEDPGQVQMFLDHLTQYLRSGKINQL
jgi:trehalose 6-phosphate phosphatase